MPNSDLIRAQQQHKNHNNINVSMVEDEKNKNYVCYASVEAKNNLFVVEIIICDSVEKSMGNQPKKSLPFYSFLYPLEKSYPIKITFLK
jgi:hypothetical protein